MNNIQDIIACEKWRFAITYAKTSPHEYIVRDRCLCTDNFDKLCEHIKSHGHYEYFFQNRGIYCAIDDFTYWVMGDVINRRWNDMYFLTPEKRIMKVNNWEELLQDGRVSHK